MQKKTYDQAALERWGIAQTFRDAAEALQNNREITEEAMSIILEADQTGDLPAPLQEMLDIRFGRKKQSA